jgi:hypothetical protein
MAGIRLGEGAKRIRLLSFWWRGKEDSMAKCKACKDYG